MDFFKTGSGTEYQTDYFTFSNMPPFAYIRVLGKNIVECATIFSNPKEVETITYGDTVLSGYHLAGLSDDRDAIKVQLTR